MYNLNHMGVNDNQYSLPAKHVEGSPLDLHSFVDSIHFAAIQETMDMVPEDEMGEWLKRNRLMALQQLSPLSSSTNLSSYSTDSTEEMGYDIEENPSAYIALNYSPESFRNFVLKEGLDEQFFPVTKYDFGRLEKPFIQEGVKPELELAREKDFSENQKFYKANSVHQSEEKFISLSNERTEFFCKDTNHSSYEKSSPELMSDLKIMSSSSMCCGTFHDQPSAENIKNVANLPSYNAASLMALESSSGFFDSHCHIDLLFNREKFHGTYAGYMAQHKESYPKSYKGCIAVFCKPHSFAKKHLWQKHLEQDNVWGAFGCHPKSAKFYNDKIERDLQTALSHPKVKALGEIGLDYSYGDEYARLEQCFVFRRQLEIARKRNLRLVIHCRDADDDAIKIMHEVLPRDTIFHLHCFTGSWERAQVWIKEFPNVFIGITNLVTFPSAIGTHEVARKLPLDRLLLETDAPYFVPTIEASNGTRCSHPGMAIHVAAQIAALKDIPVDEVLQYTSANTRFVYNII